MHQVLQLFFWFLYLFFLMKYYGSIVIFPTFSVYFVSLVLSASPFSSKLVFSFLVDMIFATCGRCEMIQDIRHGGISFLH